jgi:hypothetical protein
MKKEWSASRIDDAGPRQKDNHYFAEKLAGLGLTVFPCGDDKRPKRGIKWRDQSTTELEKIDVWWCESPDALPAIDLAKSGLIVFDADRHGGPDGVVAFDELIVDHHALYEVLPAVITPSGGRHYYFRQPDGEPFGNSVGSLPEGIDVRGSGGYVIGPGARLTDGRRYAWDRNTLNIFTAVRSNTVPVLPPWLAQILRPNGHDQETEPFTAKTNGNRKREQGYAAAALEGCANELAGTALGGRNNRLNELAFRMGTMVASGWISRAEAERRLYAAAEACGLVKDDGPRAVRATVRSGLEAGEKQPHPELDARNFPKDGQGRQKDDQLPRDGERAACHLQTAAASAFRMRGVRWFWRDRFALGKLGLIGGLPDKGKGLISADMIARATSGSAWPCNEGIAPKGSVIWFTAEDDIEDTIIPRLVAAGADLDRVHIVRMTRNPDGSERMFNLITDLPLLKTKIDEIDDVVLVIIDPMSAYLGVGKINNASTTDVRGVLAPLTKLAEEKLLAIVGIMHFNKKADVTNAMLRIADSLAYVAAARHVYVVVDDAENDKARLFVKAKNNLAPDKHALRFLVGVEKVGHDEELAEDIWAPRVLWDSEHVKVTATQAMEAEAARGSCTARREAEEFLRSRLALGPMLRDELLDEAEAEGIAKRTLERAKQALGIKARKERGKVDGRWCWEVPALAHHE